MIINKDIEFELEDFLNEELEHSQMTPSVSVWANIRKEVQPKYRWNIWIITSLLLFVPYSLVMHYLPANTNKTLAAISISTNTSNNNTDQKTVVLNTNHLYKLKNNINNSVNSNAINIAEVNNTEVFNSNNQQDNKLNNNANENKHSSGNLSTIISERSLINLPVTNNITTLKLPVKINRQTLANSIAKTTVKNKVSSKLTLEIYATPSVSYRTMSDDKARLSYYRNIYRNNAFTDNISAKNVNTVVNQRTSMGKEIGIGTRYTIAKAFKLKAGLQFNILQYTSEAYKATGMANFAFVKNDLLDSISANAQYATAGTDKVTLTNSIYQISLPVGVEWDCIKKNNFSVGIGASLQPTYLLEDNSYILSTDYQYFSKGAKFSRQWNLNSAVDVSFNFTNKQFTWYMAPQFRYQLLTTYKDLYSIKEHRWDLGLKVGVLKTF